ncbi:MAG: phospho-N-acetylmuramoyl-pentapeptide-transferase [Culicoidibacterales bacterium]
MELTVVLMALVMTLILGMYGIPYLQKIKAGQSIREEGPQSHLTKAGTPTMGGLFFMVASIFSSIVYLLVFTPGTMQAYLLLAVFIAYMGIGFFDDYIKIMAKQNLGLTALQKLLIQIAVGVAFTMILMQTGLATTVNLGFITIDLGIFYPVLTTFLLVGFSNATNLTDGLDGLLGGTGAIAFFAFGFLALFFGRVDVAIICFAVFGSLLGFLVFNFNPAKVFMGDTGSLALGGLLAAVAVMLKLELVLLIIGLIFVIETASVMLQVSYFKITKGKRLFKMSPIHHHFELSGWSEVKVVTVFYAVGIMSAIIGIIVGIGMY